jgi:NAD(P)-dependent dehydrogenase (short-subunit alcohol dehydrogenase family)
MTGRLVLVTGGTGGVGLEAARTLRALGAEILIGSRERERYEAAAASLGGAGLHPFIADLADPEAVAQAFQVLNSTGLRPTDVVHSAAGGMEPLIRLFMRRLTGLRRMPPEQLDEAIATLRAELAPLVGATRELAMRVNCTGPVQLLERCAPLLPDGATVIFYSSLWASFWPHPQVPVYYQAVAEAKQGLERWLEAQAPAWARRRITTAIISANLIGGTRMGYLLDRFCTDLMPESDRERWRATYIDSADLVSATVQVLERERAPGGLERLWLPLPGRIVDRLGADESPMTYPVALAVNAPRWTTAGLAT